MSFEKPFRLNELVVDPVKDKLIFPDSEVSVPHKLVQLLQYFAQHANELVTKDDLMKNVWDGFVSEGTLYTQIANLRKQLKDDPNNPHFLKTVPRKGYMLVAEVDTSYQSTSPKSTTSSVPNKARSNKKLGIGFLTLLATIALSAVFFNKTQLLPAQAYDRPEADFSAWVQAPSKTLLINKYIAPYLPDEERQHIALAVKLLEYQLSSQDGLHVESAFFLAPDFLTDNLINHFESIAPVQWKVAIEAGEGVEEHSYQLTVEDLVSGEVNRSAVDLQTDIGSLANQLASLMPASLRLNNVVGSNPIQAKHLLEGSDFLLGSYKFEYLEHVRNYPNLNFEDHQQQLLNLLELGKANTGNHFISYLLLESYTQLLLRWSGRENLNEIVKQARPFITQQQNLNPNFVTPALLATHCVEERGNCRQTFIDKAASQQSLYNIIELMPLAYPLSGSSPLELARFAYFLRPQAGLNRHFRYFSNAAFRDMALAELEPHTAIPGFWAGSDHHLTRLKGKTDLKRLEIFREWYNRELHTYLDDRNANVRDIHSNVSYIAQNLLNANQPDLALRWADFTSDRIAQLESHTLASIWQENWDQYRWYTFSNMVKGQIDELQHYDIWRIAYVELFSGLPSNAKYYYERLNPELFEPTPVVNEHNVRTAVYAAETLKQLDDQIQAQKLVDATTVFLSSNVPSSNHSAYFGLTDAQFYALNGDPQRALSILEKTIKNERWLPNAFWLWPPVDKDPFLINLRKNQRFQELAAIQQAELAELCFGGGCIL